MPVAVDNDANCAARAESVHGVAAGVDDFVYLTGTVGLGAGIVCGGAGAARLARAWPARSATCGWATTGTAVPAAARAAGRHWSGLRAMVAGDGGATCCPARSPCRTPTASPATPAHGAGCSPDRRRARTRGGAAGRDPRPADGRAGRGSFVPLADVLVPAVRGGAGRRLHRTRCCTVALSTLGLHAASVGAAVDALDDVYAGRRRLPV